MFICRFIGWVRIVVPMFAGIGRMPFGRFIRGERRRVDRAAVAYCALGYLFGRDLPKLEHHLTEATLIGLGLIVAGSCTRAYAQGGPSPRRKVRRVSSCGS